MKKLTDYKKIRHLTDQISVEKVYPLSILERIQSGEIYVDDTDSPNAALIGRVMVGSIRPDRGLLTNK